MSFDSKSIYNNVSYDLEEVVRRAKSGSFLPPSEKNASTASRFGSWVYSLQHSKIISSKDYSETFTVAKQTEIIISSLMKNFDGTPLDGGRFKATAEWALAHEDPLLDNQVTRNFEAPNLTLAGNPIRWRPDVVLHNQKSGELIIVE